MSGIVTAVMYISIIAAMSMTYIKLAFGTVIPKKEFKIWVISWFVVTYLAFFTFNFLFFVILSSIFILFISKKAEDKLALFLILLFAIPSYTEKFSVIISLNFTRELALVLLLPLFTSLLNVKNTPNLHKFGSLATDKFVIAFLALNFVLFFRGINSPVNPSSPAEGLRYGFYLFLELFLPYYVASRYIKDFDQLIKVIIAYISICIIVGSVGIVEIAKSWLLYGELDNALGVYSFKSYLVRDGLIRASSSMDHALILGMIMSIALGFYLSISSYVKSNLLKIAGFFLILGGLVAPLARGAWIGTMAMLLVYFSFGHKKYRNISLIILAGFLAIPLLAIIPGGQKVLNLMPFIGSVDSANVDYRQQLIDVSILVIKNHPIFGVYDPTLEPEMKVMIQGEGIVDLVNYYLQMALYYGMVGLALFAAFLLSFLWPLYKHIKKFKDATNIEYLCGKSFLALLIGTFITISTLSALNMVSTILFLLAGLSVSYIRVTKNREKIARNNNEVVEKETEKGAYPTSRVVR